VEQNGTDLGIAFDNIPPNLPLAPACTVKQYGDTVAFITDLDSEVSPALPELGGLLGDSFGLDDLRPGLRALGRELIIGARGGQAANAKVSREQVQKTRDVVAGIVGQMVSVAQMLRAWLGPRVCRLPFSVLEEVYSEWHPFVTGSVRRISLGTEGVLLVDTSLVACKPLGFAPHDAVSTPRGRAQVIGASLDRVMGETLVWVWEDGVAQPTAFKRGELELLSEEGEISVSTETSTCDVVCADWTLRQFLDVVDDDSFTMACDEQIVQAASEIAASLRADPFELLCSDFTEVFSMFSYSFFGHISHILFSQALQSRPEFNLLKDLPLATLCARFCLVRKFNRMVKAVLPCLHLAPAAFGFEEAGGVANGDSEIVLESSVGAQLCRAAALVFTRLKVELFRGVLSASKSPPRKNQYLELQWSKLTIDRAHANEDGIPGVFHQFVKLAQALPPAEFRKQEAGPLDEGQARTFKVDFVGENAADNGGPYRELFNEVVSELESDALDLLLPAPNRALGGSLPNQDKWVVNPACKKFDNFKWLGKLLGIALRCDVTLALNLPDTVWKRLVGRPVTFADVRAVDAGAGALASLQVVLSAFCFLLSALCFLLFALCFLLSAFCFLLSALCSLLSAFCFLLSILRTFTGSCVNSPGCASGPARGRHAG
jgi:hypothetical protein